MHAFRYLIQALVMCSLLVPGPAAAWEADAELPPIIDYRERFLPVVARQGMVVATERLAAEVGKRILQQGGNAVDAAVATGFALAVTYPRAGNLAGGGFMLIHLAAENRQVFIDYRETAPRAGLHAIYRPARSSRIGHSGRSSPWHACTRCDMSRKEVLAPASELAEKGFPVSFSLNYEITARGKRLRSNPEALRLFFRPDGKAYDIGETWRQPDLAWTLSQIAKNGRDGFYKGEVARRIAAEMEAGGGLITLEDLAAYRAVERTPIRGNFRGFEILSSPPPSSGGIHIVQMLNILSGYDLAGMGHNSAAYLHHLTEAMKLAYADRSKYLGDPDFVDVPVAALTDPAYAARQRRLIDSNKATPSAEILPGRALVPESLDTTHYNVVDPQGNAVSNTYTLNASFGSAIAVPGTGMLLNNEMPDFAARPGHPNMFKLVQGESHAIEGGKRPVSSMSPTLVFRDGKLWLVTGTPGGSKIITIILQVLLNTIEFNMNVATAGISSRIHHQWLPDQLQAEQGISPDTVRLLREMGHDVLQSNRTFGRTHSIMLEDGRLYGATDTRRPEGWVAGY